MNKLLVHTKDKELVALDNARADTVAKYLKGKSNVLWLDMENPSEEDMDILIDTFKFHALAVEDVIFPHNFPKIETFDDYLFITIHAISCKEGPILNPISQEINIFFGKNFIVSVHEEPIRQINSAKQRCKSNSNSLQKGSDFILHMLLDSITEGFFPILDRINDQLEIIEGAVLKGQSNQEKIMGEMLELKHTLLDLRKVIVPQRNVLSALARSDGSFIKSKTLFYFRDVYDHMLKISDSIELYRELLSSTMEGLFTVISNRLNETMKTLTILATFMMPLTMITSFYGMNVKAPEFEWGIWGYFWVWGIILAVVIVMFIFFKRKKWF